MAAVATKHQFKPGGEPAVAAVPDEPLLVPVIAGVGGTKLALGVLAFTKKKKRKPA